MKKLVPIQITNSTAMQILNGHPWLFRNKFARYEKDLRDGDWIQLIGTGNKELGVGIYSKSGLIAVRIFYFGENFTLDILRKKIEKRLEKRIELLKQTNSLRWIHGENDNLPGVTVDGHGNCLVFMFYSSSLKLFARYVSRYVYVLLINHENVKTKPEILIEASPNRKGFSEKKNPFRILKGKKLENVEILYQNISFQIDPFGQKSGMYNDIRNLRNYIFENSEKFRGKKILNLFSSNGLLSICLERAGGELIVSVDDSRKAISVHTSNLSFRAENLTKEIKDRIEIGKQIIWKGDIFKDLKSILDNENIIFDVIIIDPPSLTAKESDKEIARKLYKRIIVESIPYLKEKGDLILCSCSNRIHVNDFEKICKEAIKSTNRIPKTPIRLKNEMDHPTLPTFPEGNYFKAHIYENLFSIQ